MKNTLVIAAREFEEKRFVAYAAVAFAILPFIFAAIPAIGGKSPRETIAIASLIFATACAAAQALMTGASFIGRDLSDGRLSFYFSRPVSSASIWFGKLTAGILMIVGCFGVIIAPAWLATGQYWTSFVSLTLGESTKYVLTAALALFLIAHVISTFARSRSPLIVFDFAAAVICGVAIRFLVLPLRAGEARTLISMLATGLSIALVIGIVGGGAWQLERGRTDRRRNHLALSQFLWGTMAVALLLAAGFVGWVVSVKVSDLSGEIRAVRSTSGPFAVIAGSSRGRADYMAGFLLNTEDGSAIRLDSYAEGVRFTRDGRSAVVPRVEGKFADVLIYRRGAKEPVDTGLTISPGEFFVSDDAGRIATLTNGKTLSVYDVAQKRSLVSVLLPESRGYVYAFFQSPDVVRLYLNSAAGMKIMELDVRARALRETGLVASTNYVYFYPDASAAHLLVRPVRGDVVTLNDARTGALITPLASAPLLQAARFLRDGRIVILDGPLNATVMHILSADGVPQRDIPIGPANWGGIIGDDGSRVILVVRPDAGSFRSLIAVDINRGVVEHRETIRDLMFSGMYDLRPPIEPLREVFFSDANKRIVAWNVATGAKRVVAGG